MSGIKYKFVNKIITISFVSSYDLMYVLFKLFVIFGWQAGASHYLTIFQSQYMSKNMVEEYRYGRLAQW